MFRESLLESSKQEPRQRWPMLTAFAGEIIVAGLLVLIPLLTTAVIHVSAHVNPTPLGMVRVAPSDRNSSKTGPAMRANGPATTVLTLANTSDRGSISDSLSDKSGCCDPSAPNIYDPNAAGNLPTGGGGGRPAGPSRSGPIRVSNLSEAQLLKRIEPVYPHIAMLAHRQGDVKLHAVISKDGTIESLSVMNGEPLFAAAAVDAVRQWRYRPYLLNGEPVEVETFITVSFKGIRD